MVAPGRQVEYNTTDMNAVNPISAIRTFSFTVYGEPASKANSRRLVPRVGKDGKRWISSIKSEKALNYSDMFLKQCPTLDEMFQGDVAVYFEIYYASRRPDLDESLILDLMQGRIYKNDRSCKARCTFWGLDPACPRTVIHIASLEGSDFTGALRRDVRERFLSQGGGGLGSDT